MTREEQMRAWIAKHHDPDGWQAMMVYSIWEDGEVTLEKGGELFGWRNLHCVKPASIAPWPIDLFPGTRKDHRRIFLAPGAAPDTALREMQEI